MFALGKQYHQKNHKLGVFGLLGFFTKQQSFTLFLLSLVPQSIVIKIVFVFQLCFRIKFCDRSLHYCPSNAFWSHPYLHSFLSQTSLIGQSWISTPCPSNTLSSFPIKEVGEWLCLGWVSPKYFVGTLYVMSPRRDSQVTRQSLWLHLFETIATMTRTKLHLGVFYYYSFMVSYTGMNGKDTLIPNTMTLALPVQLCLWVV